MTSNRVIHAAIRSYTKNDLVARKEEARGWVEVKGVMDVFILDIRASEKKICQAHDGEMIRFNQEGSISLNPFSELSGRGAKYTKALELL